MVCDAILLEHGCFGFHIVTASGDTFNVPYTQACTPARLAVHILFHRAVILLCKQALK